MKASKPATSMIRNWVVKRHGTRLTVAGTDLTGRAVDVRVSEIRGPSGPGGFPTATDHLTGATYALG